MYGTHTLKYAGITEKIIGCAMRVHNYFGKGFPEVIYHRALLIELRKMDIDFESEIEKTVMYYDEPIGKRRVDLIVAGKILVELKAISEVENDAVNQILNCLHVFDLEVGLLLNFGRKRLEYRRFIYKKE